MPTPSSMTSLVFYKCVSGTTLSSPCLLFAPPHFFLPFASSLKATSHDPPAASDVVSLVHTLLSVTSLLFCQLVRLQVCMMSVWLPFSQISASCVCVRAHSCTPCMLSISHTHAYTHTVGRRVISSVTTSGSSNSDSTRAIYSRRGSLHTVWHVMTCVPARLCGKGACGTWKKSQVCACVCVGVGSRCSLWGLCCRTFAEDSLMHYLIRLCKIHCRKRTTFFIYFFFYI